MVNNRDPIIHLLYPIIISVVAETIPSNHVITFDSPLKRAL